LRLNPEQRGKPPFWVYVGWVIILEESIPWEVSLVLEGTVLTAVSTMIVDSEG
jgi:hypothetical protein